jgi:hypothetical protein
LGLGVLDDDDDDDDDGVPFVASIAAWRVSLLVVPLLPRGRLNERIALMPVEATFGHSNDCLAASGIVGEINILSIVVGFE